MAESHCRVCAAPVKKPARGRTPQFCGNRCKYQHGARQRGVPEAHRAPRAVCGGCGREFAQRITNGQRLMHCSRRCAGQVSKAQTQERVAREQLVRREVAALGRIGAKWRAAARDARRCQAVADRRQCRCAGCGTGFIQRTHHGRPQVRCDECARAEARRLKKRAKRVRESRMRARRRGVQCERIDPLAVLERDGWRCMLCGIGTPRRLRGTCDPRAPEMDHIIPLAAGGTHTWGNVQCACRACNHAKGARPLGQLGLPIAV